MRSLLLAALACAAVAIPVTAHAGCVDEFGKPRYEFDVRHAGDAIQHAEDETFELVDCVK
jgi:hypothetical protein